MNLKINFPENLPVSKYKEEIENLLVENQVIIVCGETGSGKTTQLPKIALNCGFGKNKLIGHTQPRRIAATSIAKRIAEELNSQVGEIVGYKIRFQDKLQKNSQIKLMTDGILLAETLSDPLLKNYEVLIIDEAHERSLNIDFLLGYLKQILPKRPDLKIIITSATIDAEKFSKHFNKAPIINVEGRSFPVQILYRDFQENEKENDLNNQIILAIEELWQNFASGDILIFLPGEREIREAQKKIKEYLQHFPIFKNAEILPLFSRLSQVEQTKIFDNYSNRRIVLATNVAETSLTVPKIRYVIDSGLARVKRYSLKNKVEQLLIEPISQAASNQRSGRCGRLENGISIRLYSEENFKNRPEFTDPEILRSSLASVILRMKHLNLGEVINFPFLESPSGRAIADGYRILTEIGAIDNLGNLLPVGKSLAYLPLDPRLGRMILEAKNSNCLNEILIIVSALTIQDIRDRPLNKQEEADLSHKKFNDNQSEFMSFLRLWNWLIEAKGGINNKHKLSNKQFENLLKENYINLRRFREWKDIYSQLLSFVKERNWIINKEENKNINFDNYDNIHKSILTGLLGNVGYKSLDNNYYLGARGIKFYSHPGIKLNKKPSNWIMASEITQTTKLYARNIANINVKWLEIIAKDLLKKQVLEPFWSKKQANVLATETASLFGLQIYNDKKINYGNINPSEAREIFIKNALIEGEWQTNHIFLEKNLNLIKKIEELEHKNRKQNILKEDLIYDFYNKIIPENIFNEVSFNNWFKIEIKNSKKNKNLLEITENDLIKNIDLNLNKNNFPPTIKLGGIDCSIKYLHDPENSEDGLTVIIPIFIINQINKNKLDWLVPGMLKEKIFFLIKNLPQKLRSNFIPINKNVEKLFNYFNQLNNEEKDIIQENALIEELIKLIEKEKKISLKVEDFKLDNLPNHLLTNIKIIDKNKILAQSRNFDELKAKFNNQARGVFESLQVLKNSNNFEKLKIFKEDNNKLTNQQNSRIKEINNNNLEKFKNWQFGTINETIEFNQNGQKLIGYPALIDLKDGVNIKIFDELNFAKTQHKLGLKRLFIIKNNDLLKYLAKNIPNLQKLASFYLSLGSLEELKNQILDLAIDLSFLQNPLPNNEESFQKRQKEGRGNLNLKISEISNLLLQILNEYKNIINKKDLKKMPIDLQNQLNKLINKNFIIETNFNYLKHYPRYLKSIFIRLNKLNNNLENKADEIFNLENKFYKYLEDNKIHLNKKNESNKNKELLNYRFMLEELRISFFAQELKTLYPVSIKRLDKIWQEIINK